MHCTHHLSQFAPHVKFSVAFHSRLANSSISNTSGEKRLIGRLIQFTLRYFRSSKAWPPPTKPNLKKRDGRSSSSDKEGSHIQRAHLGSHQPSTHTQDVCLATLSSWRTNSLIGLRKVRRVRELSEVYILRADDLDLRRQIGAGDRQIHLS